MKKLKQALITTIMVSFILWAFLALFQTLVPWWGETFGPAEENIGAKLQLEEDAKLCYPKGIKIRNGVVYCHCGDNEYQKAGKCR